MLVFSEAKEIEGILYLKPFNHPTTESSTKSDSEADPKWRTNEFRAMLEVLGGRIFAKNGCQLLAAITTIDINHHKFEAILYAVIGKDIVIRRDGWWQLRPKAHDRFGTLKANMASNEGTKYRLTISGQPHPWAVSA